MSRNPSPARTANLSGNPTFASVLDARFTRRAVLRGGLAGALLSALPACAGRSGGTAPRLTFTPIEPSTEDSLHVAPGYEATILLPWGEPVGMPGRPSGFRFDASNTAA